jgi:hypothetical protein
MLGEGQPRRPPASIWAQPGPPTDQFIAFERGVFGRRRDLRQGGKPLSRRDCQAGRSERGGPRPVGDMNANSTTLPTRSLVSVETPRYGMCVMKGRPAAWQAHRRSALVEPMPGLP